MQGWEIIVIKFTWIQQRSFIGTALGEDWKWPNGTKEKVEEKYEVSFSKERIQWILAGAYSRSIAAADQWTYYQMTQEKGEVTLASKWAFCLVDVTKLTGGNKSKNYLAGATDD